MANRFSVLFATAAFLVAWVSGLAADVSPEAILVRSLAGAAGFYLLGRALCWVAAAFLGFPSDNPADNVPAQRTEQGLERNAEQKAEKAAGQKS